MTISFEHGDPWADRLSEYLDGVLTGPETREIEAHLQTCERCRTSLADLRAVIERLHADQPDQVADGSWSGILGRLKPITPDTYAPSGRARRYSRGIPTRTLRRITAVAALTVAFAGGIWTGASLSLARAAWTPPGWLHIWPRGRESLPRRSQRTPTPAADSILDQWTPLRRALTSLDQQIASITNTLQNERGNKALQRMLERLIRQRNDIRTLLDSATSAAPSIGVPER
jgi:hypothetical protein